MKKRHIIARGIIFGLILTAQAGSMALAQTSAGKNIDDSISTSSTTTPSPESQVFGRGVDTVKNMVPESVKNTTGGIFAILNDFRLREYILVEIARIDNIERIDALNQKEVAAGAEFAWKDHVERVLRYTHWMFLVLGGTILKYSWIFYFVVFLVTYGILRAIWRRIRGAGV